ncbi:hypothetical protein DLE54_07745 [Psychrobacter sp. YP14]|uniref:heavy-metal-associated domain-containing protein n=1 Tax=Psychrobacter TaxID=497 RepID=UPI000D7D8B41|nr:copper ion binding protein [Psychrobacter sp. YP14]AWT49408.1 hypothetical protein DLE54_07745 [Psychrobacter sp. YP14]
MSLETTTIHIEGMTCGGCVKSVEGAVSQLSAVQSIDVDLAANQAVVSFDNEVTSIESVLEAIEDAGFDATVAR